MRTMSYKSLRNAMFSFEIKHSELAEALGMSPTSLSARMTGKLPWTQDEMYAVCDYINTLAKNEDMPPPFPYEKIHEAFPPRQSLALASKNKNRKEHPA